MTKKVLNKDKLITFIFIIVGAILIATVGVKIYFDFFKGSTNEPTELKRLELYGYTLESDDIEVYTKYYNELSGVLDEKEINYEEYAKLLTKLYIIDFYTLSNKIASTDIGSSEFVHPDIVDNFKTKAEDTIYKYIENNFDGKRTQELPEVMDVTIDTVEESVYTYGEKEYDSFVIKSSWSYKEEKGYKNEGTIILIKDGSKLCVVEEK